MNLKFLIISILLTCFISCNDSSVYKEFKSINNDFDIDFVSWKKNQSVVYEILLDKANKGLKPIISIRHATHYPFSNIKLNLECEMPDGNKKSTTLDLALAENNMFKGSGMGDIWDIDIPVSLPIEFDQKGTYKISIQQKKFLQQRWF